MAAGITIWTSHTGILYSPQEQLQMTSLHAQAVHSCTTATRTNADIKQKQRHHHVIQTQKQLSTHQWMCNIRKPYLPQASTQTQSSTIGIKLLRVILGWVISIVLQQRHASLHCYAVCLLLCQKLQHSTAKTHAHGM